MYFLLNCIVSFIFNRECTRVIFSWLRPCKHSFFSIKKTPPVKKPRMVQCALTCHLLVQICYNASISIT